ncbi:hypothetical protein F5878DRAFT_667946 [Lentinula raphanica]|uniref:Uncharacterized protein n=1 Tax=Lentinula raphanica TaxID=153919 RepID=A0AA38NV18_9AGAR|nr:hypothetical protein F5878DRAFT_667946 [Lentinula raphanica]
MIPNPAVGQQNVGKRDGLAHAHNIDTALRRVLRNKKEYSGLSIDDPDAQFFTVNFEAEALMKDAYDWQEEYQTQNEEATDERVPLKPSLLNRCQRRPSHFITLKELAKPRPVLLPNDRDHLQYKPNFDVSARKRNSDKSHLRSRTIRDHERRKKQLAANSSLKACAIQNIARSRLAANLVQTDFRRQRSQWVGQKVGSSDTTYTLEEAMAMPELRKVCWDGG